MSVEILQGDVLDQLANVESGTVRCCVTSPPYWGLRDYGEEGQLGLERTPEEYVSRLVEVFREVWRVLADDGTLWLNLGDSYAGGKTGRADTGPEDLARRAAAYHTGTGSGTGPCEFEQRGVPAGLKPKDLVGIPWRVAFALQADGWWLRSDIIWAKPNPMPESVTDRPTKGHEYLFLLARAERYYYDAEAIREDGVGTWNSFRSTLNTGGNKGAATVGSSKKQSTFGAGTFHRDEERSGRNRRTVWIVTTEPFPEAHFAVMPQALVEPCVLAGSAPGDTVLDPFCGSGTVGVVALRHRRNFLGVELNPKYVEMARRRILGPLFAA